MNKILVISLGSIGVLTLLAILAGLMFDKEEHEKDEGLTSIYDVSSEGDTAYVYFENGAANLMVSNRRGFLVQLPTELTITNLVFSEDSKKLAYTVTAKEAEADQTEIHLYDLETSANELVLSSDSLITELAFDPKQPNLLFYLQADIITNYSPIASERPHEFDIHSIDLATGEKTRHTNMKKYSMGSLQVSGEKDAVMVQMDDDDHAETPDEIFATSQRIFEIPLEHPDKKSIISKPVQADDIYDFTIIPESSEIVYQSVAGTNESGTFEYELFIFNWKTYETDQLTTLKESASNPKLGPDNRIYFILDRNFGGRLPDYQLYKIDRDGSNVQEVQLPLLKE